MKVMHLISGGDVGGARTHVLTLLRELSNKQDVTLVCFTEGDFSAAAREMGIRTRVVRGGPMALRRKLLTGLRENGYELLHCHGAKANFYGAWLRGSLKIPVIATVHSDPRLDYLGRGPLGWLYGTVNRLCLRRHDGWTAVSGAMKELLVRRGYPADRIWTIYNGIEFPKKLPHWPRRAYLRHKGLRWDEDCVVFGIAARFEPVKDVATVLRAFAHAAAREPNIRLLIAGDGEQRRELEKLAREQCPPDTVHFAGWQSDMNSFYHSLDVNLLGSVSETFPYAITEGARMYCATVATAVGGVPDAVRDGETGFLVSPGDWQTMAARMVELAQNAPLRRRMGIALHDRVRREFSAESMARRQTEIYAQVLRRWRQERYGVVVCGAYGRGNVGDEAIAEQIVRQLRRYDPAVPVTVLSRDPKQTALRLGVDSVHSFDLLRVDKALRRSHLYISGGGSLIQNVTSGRSLRYYLQGIRRAKRSGCRVMLYGCGIGPVRGAAARRRTGQTLDRYADVIALRDALAMEELRSMGVSGPRLCVTADPAVLTQPDTQGLTRYWEENGLDASNRYALFALRPWHGEKQWLAEICAAAQELHRRRGIIPLFVSMEPRRDEKIAQRAAKDCAGSKVLTALPDGGVFCALAGRMELVVSMRLHGLIFAAGQNVPTVGISYDPKVAGFMRELGSDRWLELEGLDRGSLIRKMNEAMESGDLGPEMTAMAARAGENGGLAAETE